MKIKGLNSTPEYNGTIGTVTKWNEQHERWQIKMDLDGSTKALKPDNFDVVSSAESTTNKGTATNTNTGTANKTNMTEGTHQQFLDFIIKHKPSTKALVGEDELKPLHDEFEAGSTCMVLQSSTNT